MFQTIYNFNECTILVWYPNVLDPKAIMASKNFFKIQQWRGEVIIKLISILYRIQELVTAQSK